MLFRFSQVVNDSLARQMPCQRLAPTPFPARRFIGFLPGSRCAVEVIVILVGIRFVFRMSCLPGRLKQRQLLFRQLLTFAVVALPLNRGFSECRSIRDP
jgi:hypothetical protein